MKSIFSKLLKRKKLFISLVSVIVLGLGVSAYMIIGNATAGSETISKPSATQNAIMEKPSDKTVADLDPKQNLYIAQGELKRAGSFEGVSNGSTVSAGVEQKVYSRRVIKGDTVFKESVSASSMVQVGEQRMAHGESYVIRPASYVKSVDDFAFGNTASRVSKAAFEDRYGCRGTEISSYILNDETIVSATYDGYDDSTGLYSFTYTLDNDKATYYILHEMRTNAGTKKFPSFEKAVVTVTMTSDWRIYSFETNCVYKVALFGGVSCTERLTEIFSNIGTVSEIPEYAFFEPYFDAEETDGEIEKEPDALSVLAELFAAPLADGKINAVVDAVVLGEPVTASASVGIDMKAADILASLTADVKLGDLFVRYDRNGIVLKYGDFTAKTTIDEIKSLAAAFGQSEDNAENSGFDASSILSSFVLDLGENDCTLTLPLDLDGVKIEVVIKGRAEGEGDDRTYTFDGATVTAGEYLTASVRLVSDRVIAPDLSGAASLSGVFDKIKSGNLDFAVSIGETDLYVTLDLNRKYLGAKYGDITATVYTDRAIVSYGNISAKVAFGDIANEEFISGVTDFLTSVASRTNNEKIGEIASKINEIAPTLVSVKSGFNPDAFEASKINVSEIFGVLRKIVAENCDGKTVVSLGDGNVNAKISLDNDNGVYSFGSAVVTVGGDKPLDVIVRPSDITVEPLTETDSCVDLAALASVALPKIQNLIEASGYEINIGSLALTLGENRITVTGKVVYDGDNFRINATAKIGGNDFVKGDIYLIGDMLYADVNGVRFALKVTKNGEKSSLSETLDLLRGYNDSLDDVLAAIETLTTEKIDPKTLVSSLTFDGTRIAAGLDLNGFGRVNAVVSCADVLSVELPYVSVGSVAISLDASVSATGETVTAPVGDYKTRLNINIDKMNSVFACLDFVGGDYEFLVTDPQQSADGLAVRYSAPEQTFYIGYGNTLVRGNIGEIKDIIEQIKQVAKEQFGDRLQSGSLDALSNIDVKEIIRSISIDCADGVKISARVLGIDATVSTENFGLKIELPITRTRTVTDENGNETKESYVYKTVAVTPGDGGAKYREFDENASYVDIATVFDEYFDVMVSLVKTNGWKFTVSAEIEFGGSVYKVTDAPVNFVYYGKDEFAVKIAATVQKKQSDGSFADSMFIEVAFTGGLSDGGRVYITYNDLINKDSSLKFSVSTDVLAKIVNEQLGDVREVVPQLDDILNESKRAMAEAVGTEKEISLAEILRNVSYESGNLNVCIDGSMIIGKLGDIDLTVGRHGENGLKVALGDLVYYDNEAHTSYSFALRGFTATALATSVAPDTASAEEKAASFTAEIGSYDKSNYIDLDSLSSLVSSFVTTARAQNADGSRTFRLGGTAPVKLSALSIVNVDITLGIDVRIDVKKNADGKDVVFLAAKISRGNLDGETARLAFDDLGGNSYVFYNGETGLITLKRDSYNKRAWCTKCKNWSCNVWSHSMVYHKTYVKLDSDPEIGNGSCGYEVTVTPEQFGNGIVDYLLELINFSDTIESTIKDAVNNSGEVTYGVDDIITDYSYGNSAYNVGVTLTPIDDVLGNATINVHHDENYKLTRLTGSIDLLKITGVTCKGNIDIALIDEPYGEAERLATGSVIW